MKLYTEEQINIAMRYATLTKDSYKEVLERLTPIELPSDEEIEKGANINSQNIQQHMGFIIGVEWLKKEILNQNK